MAPALRTRSAHIKFTEEQYKTIKERAARSGLRPSTWMRNVLLQAVTRTADKGFLRIREPDGATI